jgi:hypothetical protein
LAKEKESNQEQKKPEEGVKEREKLEEMAEEPPPKSQHDQRPAQNQTQNQATSENQPVNQHSPQVQELLAIFPQIQPSILEDVLAAHRNEVSACISDLLAISDPTYKPSEQVSNPQGAQNNAPSLSEDRSLEFTFVGIDGPVGRRARPTIIFAGDPAAARRTTFSQRPATDLQLALPAPDQTEHANQSELRQASPSLTTSARPSRRGQ